MDVKLWLMRVIHQTLLARSGMKWAEIYLVKTLENAFNDTPW